MTTMINDLGERMVILMRVINMYTIRESNKFTHELNGMVMAIKAMGIEYDFDFNSEVTEYTAVILMGKRFEV